MWLCIVTGGLAAIGGAYALFRVRESLQELDEVGLGAVLWVPLVTVIATSAIKVLLGLALWSPPVQDFLDHRA